MNRFMVPFKCVIEPRSSVALALIQGICYGDAKVSFFGISVLLMRCIWMYHAHVLNSDAMDSNSIGIINVVLLSL